MEVIASVKKLNRKLKGIYRKLTRRQPKLKFYYAIFYKHCKVNPQRMLVESFHGKNVSDSALAVLEELARSGRAQQYQIFYGSLKCREDQAFLDASGIPAKAVDVTSRRYTYVLATSKFLLNNSSFPAYFIRRPEQNYVQTWHGTTIKTLGREMRLGMESMYNVQHNFLHATWITFPNDYMKTLMMRDYNLEELYTGKVAMVGYPRNSVFFEPEDVELKERLGISGFTNFAYMPTWRGTSNRNVRVASYEELMSEMLEELDNRLRDDQRLFVNFHSMVASKISLGSYRHIQAFPEGVNSYRFLANMDALITDYSSVFFDFALTRRPVILFTYDMEEYLADRGLYFPIEDLPFTRVETVDELARCIVSGSYRDAAPSREQFDREFLGYESAANTDAVISLLLDDDPGDLLVYDYSKNASRTWRYVDPEAQKSVADIDGAMRSVDPSSEILLLQRTGFGRGRSAHIYDNLKDHCNYVFATRTTPRTFLEDVTKRYSAKTRERLRNREWLRLFPGLVIEGRRRGFFSDVVGSAFSSSACIKLPAELSREGNTLKVDFSDWEDYHLDSLLIVKRRTILASRPLSETEACSGTVSVDVRELLGMEELSVSSGLRLKVCLAVTDEATGEHWVANPASGLSPRHPDDVSSMYQAPFCFAPDIEIPVGPEGEPCKLLGGARGRTMTITPYFSKTDCLSLFFGYAERSIASYIKARLVSLRATGNRVVFTCELHHGNYRISDVIVARRSSSGGTELPTEFSVKDDGERYLVEVSFDPVGKRFDGIYWDAYVIVDEGYGYESRVPIITSKRFRDRSQVTCIQCDLGDGHIVFPYTAKGGKLAFIHREKHPSDSMKTRFLEMAAWLTFAIGHPYWKRKKMWLVFEKFCSLAQDNGFYFFQYCMENAPSDVRKRIFYVIDGNSADRANLEPYRRNVVQFMSYRHMLYSMVAKIYVASESKSHLYQWRPKPSMVRKRISKHKILFLQHGVTAMKRVGHLFGKRGSNPMTYFLTTSQSEQNVVMENMGYSESTSPVLGFARWDVLDDTSTPDSPSILLMPTWRSWLEEQDDETFQGSDYYRTYSSLIQSRQLQAFLEERNAHLQFYIHPKLSSHLRQFTTGNSRIEFIEMGSVQLNELIMGCSVLVTDYSSVCWDALYLDKPVVFYQFDQSRYLDEIGSYIDFDEELPGRVCTTEGECIAALTAYADSGFSLSEQDELRAELWYDFKDKENRKRIYEFLLGKGF